MKKIIICLLLAASFQLQAKGKDKKELKKEDSGTCTVTIGYADNEGNVYSSSATAETCSAARAEAQKKLDLQKNASIQ
ncbi:hypothetical protein GOQ30_12820 [Flavobacterium sp. TP390]|uniref:Uncharacterized protein n=1 Tax=Flavobacterium profundi TaxID=1774945 RepID=A0A6I4IT49_9FLAO|nr:hypothetical protein [Flavobacterium profundi]MVO10047.1 hypothetical protein [Flavobacterium profundi]